MAVALELTFQGPNATLANYKKALQKMNATAGGPHPDPDCLFHWATDIPGGFKVTDVWTGRPEFDRFAAEKIGPIGAEIGMPPPNITEIDIDSYLTAGS